MGNRAKVQQYLTQVQKRAAENSQVDANYVVEGLKMEAERAGEGSSHSARVRAYELLGKTLGMFADRVEQAGREGKPIEVSHKQKLFDEIERMASNQRFHSERN